ncbi:GloA Lactoylglutathione lyase and related lyases [Caulobacteraceae bacterium]|jgi:catechol 2,3-dioxygenase-like lactoylglutathione lyase family enzyme
MKPRISLVTLGVRDFEKSLAFYREGLGFAAHNHTEGEQHVMFRLEGSWLSLFPRDELAKDATVPDDGQGFSGITLAHNVGSKAEVDAVFAHAVSAGAKAVKPPQDVFWGGYSGYFADPDGFLWEVAWNPFTDLT